MRQKVWILGLAGCLSAVSIAEAQGTPAGGVLTPTGDPVCQITCPGNVQVGTDPGLCSANVATPQATGEGDCGVIYCSPADAVRGPAAAPRGLDAYPLGTTTILCRELLGGGDCCIDSEGQGCEDAACTSAICAVDDFCCEVEWDFLCANQALELCAVCEGASNCCFGWGDVGCDDASCQDLVCDIDDYCCDVEWDSICAEIALEECEVCGAGGNLVEGGGASCTFDVIVSDDEAPVAVAPAAAIGTDPGVCTAAYAYVPGYSDNCPGGSTVCSPPSGSTFPLGDTDVSCTATDAAGNTDGDVGVVTVFDDEPPALVCPADLFAVAPPGAQSWPVDFAVPVPTDNCPGATSGCAPDSGDPFPIGTSPVACSAVDGAGLTADCAFNVTVGSQTIQEIPTASTLGLAALALLLLGAGILTLRRG